MLRIPPTIKYFFFLLLLLLVAFWPLVLLQNTLKWDIVDLTLPWRYWLSECLTNGTLPLWNPFTNMGFPLGGHYDTWYPISWLFSLLFGYDLLAVQAEYLLHLFIGGLGFYLLAGYFKLAKPIRLMLAMSWMLSGFMVSHAQHLGYIVCAAWLPFIFYYYLAFSRKPSWPDGLKLGLSLSMLLSGGYPGVFVMTAYCLLALFGFRMLKHIKEKNSVPDVGRWVVWHGLVAAVFASLGAVVLVAGFGMQEHIGRGEPLPFTTDVWGILSGSLSPKGLWTVLFPFGASADKVFWEGSLSIVNLYFGLVAFAFLVYANWTRQLLSRERVLTVAGILFLMIAMATVFPFRKWMYELLPFMDLFRFSAVFRLFAILCFLLAAGLGIQRFLHREEGHMRIAGGAVFAAAIAGTLFCTYKADWQGIAVFIDHGWLAWYKVAQPFERMAIHGYIQLLLMGGFWLATRQRSKQSCTRWLVALTAIDLLIAVQLNLNATVISPHGPQAAQQAIAESPEG